MRRSLSIFAVAAFLAACATVKPLTPAQMAATRPASHPITNIQTIIAHTQTSLGIVNGLAFLVALAATGIAVYAMVTADKPLESIGLLVASIAGTVAIGTLVGILVLPFTPWVLLAVSALGGAGLGYWGYVKLFAKKTPVPTTTSPAVAKSSTFTLPKP
jgi:hypothetical protein